MLGLACALALLPPPGPSQAATVTTLGSLGPGNGPVGIAIDSTGDLYTANFSSNKVSKVLGSGGLAGGPWPVTVGAAPWDLALDESGSVFVSNRGSNSLSRVTATGTPTTPFAVTGFTPQGVAIDPSGNIYVAATNSNWVSKITPAGGSAGGSWPVSLGTGTNPSDVSLDTNGNLYVANYSSDTVAKLNPDGTAAGAPWPASVGDLPTQVVTDSAGNAYTSNEGTPDSVSKVTAAGSFPGAPWPVIVGSNPAALTIDSAGNLYTSDAGVAQVSKVTPAGVASVLASGGSLNGPQGITIDRLGNLYVSNFNGDTVSKIIPSGGEIAPAPPDTPAAPTAAAGDGEATVTVPANPTDARYGTPSSYTVSAVGDSSKTCTVTPPATSCEVTALSNGTSYTFTARANLNSWQTASSGPSAAVVPTAQPVPSPTVSVKVSSVKAKVTRNSVLVTSKVRVSGAGKIAQRATTKKGKKTKTWCRATKTVTQAGTYTLKCNLGKKGRTALRKAALKVTLRTTFTPTGGSAITDNRKLTLKRKR